MKMKKKRKLKKLYKKYPEIIGFIKEIEVDGWNYGDHIYDELKCFRQSNGYFDSEYLNYMSQIFHYSSELLKRK